MWASTSFDWLEGKASIAYVPSTIKDLAGYEEETCIVVEC